MKGIKMCQDGGTVYFTRLADTQQTSLSQNRTFGLERKQCVRGAFWLAVLIVFISLTTRYLSLRKQIDSSPDCYLSTSFSSAYIISHSSPDQQATELPKIPWLLSSDNDIHKYDISFLSSPLS